MNFYFLVEGDTEAHIYAHWIKYMLPEMEQVDLPEDVQQNHFYILNAKGDKRLLGTRLDFTIDTVNELGIFDYLLICIDAEEDTVIEREAKVRKKTDMLQQTKLVVIVQNRCLDTWLLGNSSIYPTGKPRIPEFAEYLDFYDAANLDPEQMGKKHRDTHAQFHKQYLKLLLRERSIPKRKWPDIKASPEYWQALQDRLNQTSHLPTLRYFVTTVGRL